MSTDDAADVVLDGKPLRTSSWSDRPDFPDVPFYQHEGRSYVQHEGRWYEVQATLVDPMRVYPAWRHGALHSVAVYQDEPATGRGRHAMGTD